MVANDAKPELQEEAGQIDHRHDSIDNEKNAANLPDEGEYVVTWKTWCVVWIL